jgi:ATPase subunit of ABC transporter with duplicated ATPase domains
VKEGSLWKDSKCNIDIIHRYIDETTCRKYNMESVIEQSDRTILLVAEPGMGKSTFLSHMEHKLKEENSAVWVLRINLSEHTSALHNVEFKGECIAKCKMFLWEAARLPEQCAANLVEKIFLQALGQGKWL